MYAWLQFSTCDNPTINLLPTSLTPPSRYQQERAINLEPPRHLLICLVVASLRFSLSKRQQALAIVESQLRFDDKSMPRARFGHGLSVNTKKRAVSNDTRGPVVFQHVLHWIAAFDY